MDKVKVNRDDLLAKLEVNRERHILQYAEACADYRDDALAEVAKAMDKLNGFADDLAKGEVRGVGYISFRTPVPESHEREYNRAISMLRMSVDAVIDIDEQRYSRYVMDDWDWKEKFDEVRMSYSNKMR